MARALDAPALARRTRAPRTGATAWRPGPHLSTRAPRGARARAAHVCARGRVRRGIPVPAATRGDRGAAPRHGQPAHVGAAAPSWSRPLFWTYFDDDAQAGVTIHWLDAGMDSGPILAQESIPLARGRARRELLQDLTARGVRLLAAAVHAIAAGTAPRVVQDEARATHEPLPRRGRWTIDFASWPAEPVGTSSQPSATRSSRRCRGLPAPRRASAPRSASASPRTDARRGRSSATATDGVSTVRDGFVGSRPRRPGACARAPRCAGSAAADARTRAKLARREPRQSSRRPASISSAEA